ncbi:DNA-binding MarR family transcriptional regulator [Peribacillus deserti]|uniref:DNA-binding MarR family transcriptional regulator n=1 Tax=Peribacillus deserti TaxID=673318 RepID=A0ABS2QH54_9BACI|nr:MarR family transcriptional regulator [Peribacillus deserti]MBM7692044.1 DNA-binding MarR family transcriptional regulator [Peribacillus deserti]
MHKDSIRLIEYDIAMLVRLTTAHSPRLGSLDRSEYLVLSELNENGATAINMLADQLKLNLSTASRQVAVLETKELIRRYPDPQNGRISLIEITPKGKGILEKVQIARHDVYSEILKNWTDEELRLLEENLSRLNKDFKSWRK